MRGALLFFRHAKTLLFVLISLHGIVGVADVVNNTTIFAVNACASHRRCSECVFDASDGILCPIHQCAWCVTEQRCIPVNFSLLRVSPALIMIGTKECADLRHATLNPTCPDMSCTAAYTTNNIYICRTSSILAICFGIILLVIDIGFFFWLHTVRQLPWKYEPELSSFLSETHVTLFQTRDMTVEKDEEMKISFNGYTEEKEPRERVEHESHPKERERENNTNERERVTVVRREEEVKEEGAQRLEEEWFSSCCPICKMDQPVPLKPGVVCFWCEIARYGFVPLCIGVSGALLGLVLLFFVSLRPWFADFFYTFLLLSAYFVYAVFAAYVYYGRASRVHVPAARRTLYIKLAWKLRCRSLLTIMPFLASQNPLLRVSSQLQRVEVLEEVGKAERAEGEKREEIGENDQQKQQHQRQVGADVHVNGDEHTLLSSLRPPRPVDILQKKEETSRLLTMETLHAPFRTLLKQTLTEEEYVLWWELPNPWCVLSHDLWLIVDLFAAAALGVWMLCVPFREVPGCVLPRLIQDNVLVVMGALFSLTSTFLLGMTLCSCRRMHVLTNHRLLTLYGDVLRGAIRTSTELRAVQHVFWYGYMFCHRTPVCVFSWEETPRMERKLSSLKSHKFIGVQMIPLFLQAFYSVAPSHLHMQRTTTTSSANFPHRRQKWRMYLFLCIFTLQLLPLVTLYPPIAPDTLAWVLCVILCSMTLASVHCGLCAQQVTVIPFHVGGCGLHACERGNTHNTDVNTRLLS